MAKNHVERLGSTDDCGFSRFAVDTSIAGDTAFAKIRRALKHTALAARQLGIREPGALAGETGWFVG
jgi:5-methyltetrahydropteroyltriglutamate--homocysteine methyltransferase